MKLVDLSPRWLTYDGKRVGFVFLCPTDPRWYQSCFFQPTSREDQESLIIAAFSELPEIDGMPYERVQLCNPTAKWDLTQGDSFENLTVHPSIDGSAGGTWHGHILKGVLVGGGFT